jgi:hypothetical protein
MTSRTPATAQGNRFRPALESLEDRQTPAVTWFSFGGTLWVTDYVGLDDDVMIRDNGTAIAGNISVQRVGIDPQPLPVSGHINRIEVRTRGGADEVAFRMDGPLAPHTSRYVEVYLGDGNDDLEVRMWSGEEALAANSTYGMVATCGPDRHSGSRSRATVLVVPQAGRAITCPSSRPL